MAIDKATLKEMVGKRITIDGTRHRVEKIVMKTGAIITRDGTEANADGVYKKGPGFFYDSPAPAKGKRKPAAAAAEPQETAREKRAREKREAAEAAEPKETAREKRARLKREAEEAEAPAKPARQRRRAADVKPGAKGDGKSVPSTKKKLVEQFDQALSERVCNEFFNLSSEYYGERGIYALTPVAVGARYNEESIQITVTLMSASKSAKEIKAYIRDNRLATDISPDDEEEDDLVDPEDDDLEDTLEDDEEEDEEAFLGELNKLSRTDLRKIAKDMEIDDYRAFTKEDLAQELSEYEESDVRESAITAGVELGDNDEEEEEDLEDEDLSDDEEEDEEDEDDTEEEEEDEDEVATVESLVADIRAIAPDLKETMVTKYVEAFLASDEIAEKFDGELVPGRTLLQEKGGKGPELLVLGLDEANKVIKLLNTSTMKTRSKTISEVVHMEVLEPSTETE
jgi:hypothetical protein